MPSAVLALWLAVHHVPWLGPWLADSLRAVLGTEAVTQIEIAAYDLQDRWNLLSRSGEQPNAPWTVPPSASPSSAATAPAPGASASAPQPPIPAFRPRNVGPVHPNMKTEADGIWVPVDELGPPGAAPIAFKTLLHPDPRRPWADVYIVALDLPRIQLHYMLGRYDPEPLTAEGRTLPRPAVIPEAHRADLLLAFNGGFKTEHRRYGAALHGVAVVPPRDGVCTVALDADEQLHIGTWEKLALPLNATTWLRQTPPCLCEDGELHAGLKDESSRQWGSLLGDTVIRRSAVGLDAERRTLFVAISNWTTARVLAVALRHAGASDAAQLDVNWSYTKILLFREKDAELQAHGLVEGFVFHKDEYLRVPAPKDFFYVVARR